MKIYAEISDTLNDYHESDIEPGFSTLVYEQSDVNESDCYVQLTYESLRLSPVGDTFATWDQDTGRWRLLDEHKEP